MNLTFMKVKKRAEPKGKSKAKQKPSLKWLTGCLLTISP